jgi:hypothetical protein
MQSTQNYWMQLGSVPLDENVGEWKTHVLLTENEDHFRAMPEAFVVLVMVVAKKPPRGTVYVDRAGLMVRN